MCVCVCVCIQVTGGGRADSATRGGGSGERVVDCILECARPAHGSGGSGLPWDMPALLSARPGGGAGNGNGGAGSGPDGAVASQTVLRAQVDLARVKSIRDLWTHLSAAFKSELLPDRLQANLIYMDSDGDWLLFAPDQPWALIANSARKLLISPIH